MAELMSPFPMALASCCCRQSLCYGYAPGVFVLRHTVAATLRLERPIVGLDFLALFWFNISPYYGLYFGVQAGGVLRCRQWAQVAKPRRVGVYIYSQAHGIFKNHHPPASYPSVSSVALPS